MRKLLILTANPKDSVRLQLDKELRDIEEGLQRARLRDDFTVISRLAVRPRDLRRAILEVAPQMVHFSGHGEESVGLYFEDEIGNSTPLTGEQLSGLFGLISPKADLECVVLNGCYSAEQAQAISQHVPYVVGMRQAVGDKAAVEFSVGFYDAIWNGESVEFAFQVGKVAAQLTDSSLLGEPVLLVSETDTTSECLGSSAEQDSITISKQLQKTIVLLSSHSSEAEKSHREIETARIDDAVLRASIAVIEKGKSLPIYRQPLDKAGLKTSEISKMLSTVEPSIIDISGPKNGLLTLLFQPPVELSDADSLIGDFFKVTSKNTDCILLNGCFMEEQAREIVQHIEFLVGIGNDISPEANLSFLNEFYYQVAVGVLVPQAYDAACNRIRRIGTKKSNLPVLFSKKQEKKRRALKEEISEVEAKIVEAPKSASLRAKKGDLLEGVGEHEKAASAYDKSLYIDKKDYKVWWKLGKALVRAEKYAEAQQPYQNALALHPEKQDEYVIAREYGSLLSSIDKHGSSIGVYKKSLWLNPGYRAASYEKRKVYKKMYSQSEQ